jgi:bacterioferritin-associated ferredoxin
MGFRRRPLYICLCHGITDKQIRTCVREGARDIADLRGRLGVATQCGCCESQALEILDETLRPAPSCAPSCPSVSPATGTFQPAGTHQPASHSAGSLQAA